jgi:hypothetical protein
VTNAERRAARRRETSRILTTENVPFLRRVLELWETNLHFKLSQTQLVTWVQKYPDDIVENAVVVTGNWCERLTKRGETIHPVSAYCYASAVMRNVADAQKTAETLLGGAQ